MNPERYEDLLSRLLEGEMTAPEAEELARALAESPALGRNLQQHLVLWEMWSHAQSPERSAEAFVRGLKTRLQAEGEGADAFAAAVRTELESYGFRQDQELEESQAILLGPSRQLTDTIRTKLRSLWAMAHRPAGIVWAASLAASRDHWCGVVGVSPFSTGYDDDQGGSRVHGLRIARRT